MTCRWVLTYQKMQNSILNILSYPSVTGTRILKTEAKRFGPELLKECGPQTTGYPGLFAHSVNMDHCNSIHNEIEEYIEGSDLMADIHKVLHFVFDVQKKIFLITQSH